MLKAPETSLRQTRLLYSKLQVIAVPLDEQGRSS